MPTWSARTASSTTSRSTCACERSVPSGEAVTSPKVSSPSAKSVCHQTLESILRRGIVWKGSTNMDHSVRQMGSDEDRVASSGLVSWTQLIYALHALSLLAGIIGAATVIGAFLTGWPSIIAVILNYVKRSEVRGTWLESHFRWQIRTFWFGAAVGRALRRLHRRDAGDRRAGGVAAARPRRASGSSIGPLRGWLACRADGRWPRGRPWTPLHALCAPLRSALRSRGSLAVLARFWNHRRP